MNILVINAGSSRLKFQVIATDLERIRQERDEVLCRGQVERIGGESIITVQGQAGIRQRLTAPIRDVSAALDYVLRWLTSDRSGIDEMRGLGDIHAVGHRVVHGGELFKESATVTDEVLKGLRTVLSWRRSIIRIALGGFGRFGRFSARRRRRLRCSIPLFALLSPNTLISTRSPTICIGVTGSGATVFTERHTGTWRFVTGHYTGSAANKRT